ncbi:lipoprotein insertase outer membrane protein LolB [Vibrio sp. TH_r3]|uniref:lipoprotein insertase outer membrane protein LolB n=1 Tax=Vibrio sp. TH_r3 TaxID=3082084 RepID=UPI002953A136|nr:lipoprotein insertase outer membrane protein LolB [Vibrio sp. TH_r3]MDV7106308.1 lipoprotein insertase outer membrane protein LolB [Vibrio sp. TH_r3]
MKKLNQYILFVCVVFFLSACSTLPEESATNVEWEQHRQKLMNIQSFQATGKIGYRGPDESISLNFHWSHTTNKSELRLINFLGSTVLTLTISPEGAKVLTSDNEMFENKDANILLANLTGLIFPVTQMQNWIKGLPVQADSYTFNQTNTLQSLQKINGNNNWTLNYDRYQDHNQLPLPYQMTLNSTDTKIKIVVSKWKF